MKERQLNLVNELFAKMQEVLSKGIELYVPKSKIGEDIIYCNINGPTDFVWEQSHRTCLFALPFEDSTRVYMNCFIDSLGMIEMNFYTGGESVSAVTITEKLMSSEDAQLVYEWLLDNTDNKGLWNPTVNEITQGIKSEARGIEIETLLRIINEYDQPASEEETIDVEKKN